MLLEERAKKQRIKWELYKTDSLVDVIKKATSMGWADNLVQVKGHQLGISKEGPIMEFVIEPYEKDCGCSSLLKYEDYARVQETLPVYTQ